MFISLTLLIPVSTRYCVQVGASIDSYIIIKLLNTFSFKLFTGVGQNVAWALTKNVNFTKIIDDLWYRDITKLQPGYIEDFQVTKSRSQIGSFIPKNWKNMYSLQLLLLKLRVSEKKFTHHLAKYWQMGVWFW